jgi:hypothetical protein
MNALTTSRDRGEASDLAAFVAITMFLGMVLLWIA